MPDPAMRPVLLPVVFLALAAIAAAQSRPAPDALARALQQRYQGVRDFSADFVHSYRGGVLRTQTTERGRVVIKKPGLMRWVYTAPERKEFVSDGRKVYAYIPEDRQVIVNDVPADDQATTPALFLAGRGDIARDFTAAYPPAAPSGGVTLRLTPRRQEPEYEYLDVTVDPATLQIRVLTTRDRQGGDSTLTFANLQENRGISDKEFVFRIPRGVDVITNDRTSN
ncbi:MAG: outer membrane lipoprotein carrier protein LolA [Acidobacteria bacterium RIFCSPLOWO2_02_FULL_67_21]|nr:MAG: outer membrane lipoprotein carrier protein LolA [Acidobacteria bacterium RIFCSPLOWO2_02_FULL_67_21]